MITLRRRFCNAGLCSSTLLLLLFLLSVPVRAADKGNQHPRAQSIRIGIIGDQTLSSDVQASYGVLQKGVSVLSAQFVDVVLHAGDLVESSLSPAQITELFSQATDILDQLRVPWYLTAGDHDVNPPGYQQDSPDRSREQLFQQLYGKRVPAFTVHPWYSFDMKGYHFISLYSFKALWSDSRFGNIFLSRIYDDQFAFLRSDLAAHANARAIIVWVHQPLWYNVSGWKRVHELLRKYPVAAVISGHLHYNQDAGVIDGIHYFTVGATGGSKKDGNRQAGNVDHVSVLTVSGRNRVHLDLLALDNHPLHLTPRVDMDRVQALELQFGNFFDFSKVNQVFVKNGQLVRDCSGGSPALIQMPEIGNPIDLPLDVQISLAIPGVTLSNPEFAAGVCQQTISGTECALKPDIETALSNYSSVTISTVCDPNCKVCNAMGEPIWKSGLNGSATPGTRLNFRIKTAFQGEGGEFFLQTSASTAVQSCP